MDKIRKPILVLGFERSGTTLLRRLISMNPALKHNLLHEEWRLFDFDSPESCMKDYHTGTGKSASIESGEKIAYRANVPAVKDYVTRWFKWWPDAIGFHIVRDGVACARSAKRVFNRDYYQTLRNHRVFVSDMQDFLAPFPVIEISYEQLVSAAVDVTRGIYKAIGHVPDPMLMSRITETKDPWEHEGKQMCGLRYHGKVEARS